MILLAITASAPAPAGPKIYLAAPDVAWPELLPYIHANIVPYLSGEHFDVFVCADKTDRSVLSPFDDALSDFAKALVMQAVITDRRFERAFQAVVDGFRPKVQGFDDAQRAGYRALFWADVSANSVLLPRLRLRFDEATAKGRLRCRVCEEGPEFVPRVPRVRR